MEPLKFKTEWIKIGGASKEFVDFANQFGRVLKNGRLTSSQFRNFYSTLKTIEMKGFKNTKTKFYMLKPLLAYGQARHGSTGYGEFKKVMDQCLDFIMTAEEDQQEPYFKNFCRIVEAILAYHRAHGGN
ncbi:type III-A CRISPR-associated protein Csm2 [Calditrichota bacterium LG25]